MPRPVRAALAVAFVGYLAVVGLLVLSPTPEVANSGVLRMVGAASRLGYDLPVSRAEFSLNVLVVVPLSLLGGLVFSRTRPTAWVASVYVASLTIEIVQLVGLADRTGSSRDVVAATLGALVGVGLLVLIRRRLSLSKPQSPRWPSLPRPQEPRWSALSRPPIRSALTTAYVLYLAAVVYLVWAPNPGVPGRSVLSLVDLAATFGVEITSSASERGLNVLMLVPLSLIGGLLIRRMRLSDWVVAGFVLSAAVEIVQRIVLPTRSGSARDIVANTLGSLAGAAILTVALALWAERSQRRQQGEPATVIGTGTLQV